jgi:membrane protein implicated in regulation of membrane protease activity
LFYSLIRIGMFAVVLAALLLLLPDIASWISAVIAAIIAFTLSYIFLRGPREAVSRSMYEARQKGEPTVGTVIGDDENVEDAAVEGSAPVASNIAPSTPPASTDTTDGPADAPKAP